MLFLNVILVGGAAAAVIPLIIHLLNRTRFRVLDWGAMHLLESALKINSRRVQWQAWLLLLLRMLIPALLALCLARPVLTAWRTATGGNQHSVVLIIDNSLSMEARADRALSGSNNLKAVSNKEAAQPGNAGPLSCFETALAEAASLIQRFGPSTELTILTSGGGVVDQTAGSTFDTQRAMRRLHEIRPGAGASAMGEALSAGLQQLSKAKQQRRHLILLSDYQRSEWEALPPETLAAIRASNTSAAPIEVTLIPIVPATPDNLSVQIDRPPGASVVAHHQPLEVRASIRNHGRLRVKNLPVVLSADGVSLASKNVEVAGDSQVFLVFTCQLQTLGSHVLSVSIDEAAARAQEQEQEQSTSVVSSDDVARWSVEVIEPVQVGIVSTRASNAKAIDDAMFLNLALSPYAVSLVGGSTSEETAGWAEAHAGADPIQCQIVSPQDVNEKWLASRQAIALMNVPGLDAPTADRIANFVENGGLLLIWPGDALQSDWYNRHWGSGSSRPLLPFDYGKLSRPADRGQATLKIQSQNYEHPALTLFNRSSNGRLDSIDFNTWYQLQASSASAADPVAPAAQAQSAAGAIQRSESSTDPVTTGTNKASLTMLKLDNGDPLLAERAVGRGRVMQWATSCGERWSSLPLREVFVPMMQQLVLYGATASTPRLNLETGAPLAITFSPADSSAKADDKPAVTDATKAALPKVVELLTPQNVRYRLEVQAQGDQRTVQFARTQFPGAYQLSGVREQPLAIVVNPSPEESVLTPLTSSALNGIAERLEAQIQPSAADFWESELVKQTGREIWRWLLAALVACLLLELCLQQSLTRTPA